RSHSVPINCSPRFGGWFLPPSTDVEAASASVFLPRIDSVLDGVVNGGGVARIEENTKQQRTRIETSAINVSHSVKNATTKSSIARSRSGAVACELELLCLSAIRFISDRRRNFFAHRCLTLVPFYVTRRVDDWLQGLCRRVQAPFSTGPSGEVRGQEGDKGFAEKTAKDQGR